MHGITIWFVTIFSDLAVGDLQILSPSMCPVVFFFFFFYQFNYIILKLDASPKTFFSF